MSVSKKVMDRINFMLCCNMAGGEKLNPLVMRQSRKPKYFQDQWVPLPRYFNKKSCIVDPIFDRDRECNGRKLFYSWEISSTTLTIHPYYIRIVLVCAHTIPTVRPINHVNIRKFESIYWSHLMNWNECVSREERVDSYENT